VEAVSLIEEKPKRVRRKAEDSEDKPRATALPVISKILAPEPVAAPTPAPVPAAPEEVEAAAPTPAAPTAAQPEAAAAAGAASKAAAPGSPIIITEKGEKVLHLKPPIHVKELAGYLGLKPFQLIHDLMEMNIFAAVNHTIEPDVATKVCAKHGVIFEKDKRKEGGGVHKVEVVIEAPKPEPKPEPAKMQFRAPVVTFMGHVDHGKTSLMDSIRKSRVALGESGGITQHIGAYSVEVNSQRITFLDTPGHAAFTAMRARGANVTDIVVLVVAADDGLMPQTIEAINHAKAAKVTVVVAINKIDLPGANVDRVKTQLQEKGLTPEDWGGETICCPVSALKGTGIKELLEMILLQAEVLELKANPKAPARGSVIEAQMEPGRGPTGTIIVKDGTLKPGKPFICGNYYGKVKALIDADGKQMKEAGPAMPAKVLGFSGLPNAGDELIEMESEKAAKALSEERLNKLRTSKLATPQRATLENLFATIAEGQKPKLKAIIKSDVQGSLEAIVNSLNQIESKKVEIEIIHAAVGPISESDVLLASASNAVVIGFGVKVETSASAVSKREAVQIKLFSIIYELIDQVKEAMAGMLEPESRESVVGHAEVKKVFDLTKGRVAGCVVTDGRVARNLRARLLRGRQPIYDGGFATLRRFQDDVKEVRSGLECGIRLGDYSEYQPGDIIECYQLEKVPQKL
jgi:translation initiation factor IF-2